MLPCDVIETAVGIRVSPFDTDCAIHTMLVEKKKPRLSLWTDLYDHHIGEDLDQQHFKISMNKRMFESCCQKRKHTLTMAKHS